MKITSSAILIRNNKILAYKRSENKKCYAGFWDVTGGHVEEKETPEDALKREVKEELGIDVIEFKFFDAMKNVIDPTSKEIYNHYYFIVTSWKGEIKNQSDAEELKWIGKDEIDDFRFTPEMKELLKKVLK